ncbi:hypothetical protein MUP77_07140 [Candidatus Bathyarchaeota archaeon]|nr:hypothetical protein [Candidatus Bathyarchaeota archaeon]
MSEEPYYENAKTWCPLLLCEVTLTLECKTDPVGSLLTGKPTNCNNDHLQCRGAVLCLLKADQITTRRSQAKNE